MPPAAAAAKTAKSKSTKTKPASSTGSSAQPPAAPEPAPAAAPAKPAPEAAAAAPSQDAHAVPTLAGTHGRPDQAAYNAEQDAFKAEIATYQAKLDAVRAKLSGGGKDGPHAERRTQLRKEQEELREQQAKIKNSRGKVLDQIKASQEGIQKKADALKAAKSKTTFRTTIEIDQRISYLDKQVESGQMKVVEEKKALAEISNLRRVRKTFETFQVDEDFIQAERVKIDELRKQLDDPEQKAISDRYEAIRTELAEIHKEGDELYASRSKLIDERNALQDKVNELWTKRKESIGAFQDARTKWYAKQQEERQRRDERRKAERQAEEAERAKEVAERLREEAQAPAFQAQIEDCQTLIDYFTIRLNGGSAPAPTTSAGGEASAAHQVAVAGVEELKIRQVDTDLGSGMVLKKKKKGEEEDAYFVGGKGKGKKGGAKAANGVKTNGSTPHPEVASPSKADSKLHLPFGTLTALLTLSIPPPTANDEIAQTIENLQKKKAYFVAVQPKTTQENIARAEAQIRKLEQRIHGAAAGAHDEVDGAAAEAEAEADADAVADAPDVLPPPNGNGEKPAEPAATPAVPDDLSIGVPTGPVDKELEAVKEDREEAAEEAEGAEEAS